MLTKYLFSLMFVFQFLLVSFALDACQSSHGTFRPTRSSAEIAIVDISTAEKELFLNVHNDLRGQLRIGALQWDDALADSALAYAVALAQDNIFQHSHMDGLGENLYWATTNFGQRFTLADAALDWGGEKSLVHGRMFDHTSGAGHYTQMIWRNTKKVGAAIVRKGNDYYVVAHYTPAGNWIGQNIY